MIIVRLFFLLIMMISLFSCATTANYEMILNSWLGVHADKLISSWGPPNNMSSLSDGGRVFEYIKEGSIPFGGFTYYTPVTTYNYGSVNVRSYGSYSGSSYGSYSGSSHGSYSDTSTTYIPQRTPIYNIQLIHQQVNHWFDQ